MHAVLADRAEQRASEAAMPAAAHNQQLRAASGLKQRLSGMAVYHLWLHGCTLTSLAGSTAELSASASVFSASSA